MERCTRVQPTNAMETNAPQHHFPEDYETDDASSEEWLPIEIAGKSDNRRRVAVVGNCGKHVNALVDILTNGISCKKWTTPSGLTLVTHSEPSPGRVFLATTPLKYIFNTSVTAVAKQWISQNSLRRTISGRPTIVICVIAFSELGEDCFFNTTDHQLCWLDALRLVFRDYNEGMLFLVNKCPRNISNHRREGILRVVGCHQFNRNNVIFCADGADERTLVEQRMSWAVPVPLPKTAKNKMMRILSSNSKRDFGVTPVSIKEVQSSGRKYEIWGPDRILLFGRSGSGKSTLAQMLTTGKLDWNSEKFTASAGLRGCTRKVERGEGRGWYVVDTPGFGEPNCHESTVTNNRVQKIIKNFIAVVEGTFTHYLFVFQKGRIDDLDMNLWKFFKLLFGDDLNSHFSVVVSNADSFWVEENIEYLRECFAGCKSFLWAEFPGLAMNENQEVDRDLESENEVVRKLSLGELEQQLDSLRRCDRPCYYGRFSRMTTVMERDRCDMDNKLDRALVNKSAWLISEAFADLDKLFTALVQALTISDKVVMLPVVL